jgi:hypothetical protein
MLVEPLLGCGEMQARVLRWWRDLHPVVLSLIHRDTVFGSLSTNKENKKTLPVLTQVYKKLKRQYADPGCFHSEFRIINLTLKGKMRKNLKLKT